MHSKVIPGSRPYHSRSPANEIRWKRVCERVHYDPKSGLVCADTDELQEEGVDLPFIKYAVKQGYLVEVHENHQSRNG